jgi:radical SAM superfamily enzyme YgiQ (UPF0313 family)
MAKSRCVMLCLLPFWSPLTPPLGISVLKGHLEPRGNEVVLEDFNADPSLWTTLPNYVELLRRSIPEKFHGNLFDYAYDIIHNHIMAHVHGCDDRRYHELVSVLVEKTFGVPPERSLVVALIGCVDHFLATLERSVSAAVERHAPGWVGISAYTTTLGASLAALRIVRKADPNIKTVLGGGVFADHVAPGSPNFDALLKVTEPYLDAIVIGEGELILERLLAGELPVRRTYSSADLRGALVDLRSPALPDFGGLDVSLYSQMATYVGRSCPFQCSFCSETVQWGKYRTKSADRFVDEMISLKQRYGGKAYLVADSLINPVADQIFAATSEAGLSVFFDAYLRADADACDPAKVAKWREGGFYRGRLGIESGSPEVLRLMNKQTAPSGIRSAIRTLASHGIKTTTYWVIGHPGETESDFQDTLSVIDDCADSIYEAEPHTFYFFPRGQISSKKWSRDFKVIDLYGDQYADLLVTRTWALDAAPTRAQTLDRVSRFVAFCKERKIPNPYSLRQIQEADERWIAAHPQSGPALLDLHNSNYAAGSLPAEVEQTRPAIGLTIADLLARCSGSDIKDPPQP